MTVVGCSKQIAYNILNDFKIFGNVRDQTLNLHFCLLWCIKSIQQSHINEIYFKFKVMQKSMSTHAVCAEVTQVIASNKHGDNFPVIVEINAL